MLDVLQVSLGPDTYFHTLLQWGSIPDGKHGIIVNTVIEPTL